VSYFDYIAFTSFTVMDFVSQSSIVTGSEENRIYMRKEDANC